MTSRYIVQQGRTLYFRRRAPIDLAPQLGRFVKIALGTDSFDVARRLVGHINTAVETYWAELRLGGETAALRERYQRAVALSRRLGWVYRPLSELVAGPVGDAVERLESLQDTVTPPTIVAVMGGVERPVLLLSDLYPEYARLTPELLRGKNERQIRGWRLARERAVRNLISVIGDKPLTEVTRTDALIFRDWWAVRLGAENLAVNTANRDLIHIKGMIRVVDEKLGLGFKNPFADLMFRETDGMGKNRGETVSTDWIRGTLLGPGALSGVNEEARCLVAILVETGARPGEICGLEPEDILLEGPVPHIKIRPNAVRAIKTSQSRRDIPLVGAALEAARQLLQNGGIQRYRGKTDSFTTAINKYMNEHNLFETKTQSLYSLRHAFQDRLIAVDAPDRIAAELMGHTFHRPRYGAGATLKHKQEWLEKIAVG
ncbi:tyrosine-type recombinase/integrase [Haematospirillum sp. 15-248]|uniref:DUF6538 domain-containing protein n=1 Tax=Haematospirillum sp. 15-248 TaxID=2723107 RepID=UPI00143A4653|nr:tyrosine-type recombinase/integrase [Haematospirillum sp. 15-248]NKD88198.1 tyrosine-type recombinase/integrase [Haematospirillum sp. 15-248]